LENGPILLDVFLMSLTTHMHVGPNET